MRFDEDYKQELKNRAEMDQTISDLKNRLRKVVITNIVLVIVVFVALAVALIIAMR